MRKYGGNNLCLPDCSRMPHGPGSGPEGWKLFGFYFNKGKIKYNTSVKHPNLVTSSRRTAVTGT